MKRVAIIGAGASGLIALRHLITKQLSYQCVVYEASNRIGGTWCYSEHISDDERQRPMKGAMYQNLITNLPKEVMSFPDIPFDKSLPSFIKHSDVQQYLEHYVKHHGLDQFIKFSHIVDRVSLVTKENEESRWRLQVRDKTNPETVKTTDEFDAVFVCNGHYSKPYIPELEGSSVFRGTIEHSRHYRKPDMYAGKTVVILGAKPSGQDISMDVAKVAKKVIISHRNERLSTLLPTNLHERYGIQKLTETDVLFENDELETDVDHIILCTGYEFSTHFIDESCGINNDGGRVFPLYKHIVNVNNPSMFFIGICQIVCPFQHFDVQARYAISWLENTFKKPTIDNMFAWLEQDYNSKIQQGLLHKYAHMLGGSQWDYNTNIALEAGIEDVDPVIRAIYDSVWGDRHFNVLTYRSVEFSVLNKSEFDRCGPF